MKVVVRMIIESILIFLRNQKKNENMNKLYIHSKSCNSRGFI